MQRRLPRVRLWNLYGQTEIAPVATVLKPEDQLRKAGSAGRPALNVETRVVDDNMNDVDVYVVCDFPDAASVAAVSLAVSATGMVRIKTTALLTVAETDQALSKSVKYRAPGA